MAIRKIFITGLSLLLLSPISFSQDKRTIDTKIADLLAQLPANDIQYTDKLMGDMLALGEQGIKKICDQVVPAGTGDDTKPRFAIETLSRFLSRPGKENEKTVWEKICVTYVLSPNDPGVKDFFIKQLQLIGGNTSAEALKIFLTDRNNCYPAVSALSAIGGKAAEQVLAGSLKDKNLPCAAAVMNALAAMNSQLAVNEYIVWAGDRNVNTAASAYNALARSGSPLAYPVLLNAAKSYQYHWERTGATSALINYARIVGEAGDIKTMDKICKLLISKCNDKLTYQNKTAALGIYVSFHGLDAMKYLLKAASHTDKKYRNSAINMTSMIKEGAAISEWVDYFPKAIKEAKPEIINMLGNRRDAQALALITSALNDQDPEVRIAAAEAITKISGKGSVPSLISYLMKYNGNDDQAAAVSALKSVSGTSEIMQLKPVLRDGSAEAKASAISLMAWNKEHEYFKEILPFSSSSDKNIKAAAIRALVSLAGSEDQKDLIKLISETDDPSYLTDLQEALASAANKTAAPEERSELILAAMEGTAGKGKLIPVLSKTGGREALEVVLKEFENGTSEMREICFKTLTSWRDYSASSALYEICASGNKTYEAPAFAGYVRQIRSASLPDEQKLLLYSKIVPYALSAERKNDILTETGKLKTYQALFFAANYLNDPAASAAAAKSVMYIALPSVTSKAGMYGTNVREILTLAMTKLQGQESEYDREMIRKYLENMPSGEPEMQAHGTGPAFRDINVREIRENEYNLTPEEKSEGFIALFNGRNLDNWTGNKESYVAEDGMIVIKPDKGSGGNLFTEKEYGDFIFRFEFQLTPGANNGLGIRAPLEGDAAYVGMELQILDNTAPVYANLQPYQYHGSVYGVIPAKRDYLKPVGDWNYQEVYVKGTQIKITLNGTVIVDGDIASPGVNGTMDHNDHPGLKNKTGHIGFLGHGSVVKFRNIRIKDLSEK